MLNQQAEDAGSVVKGYSGQPDGFRDGTSRTNNTRRRHGSLTGRDARPVVDGSRIARVPCVRAGTSGRARKIKVAVVQSKDATIKQSYKCRIESQRFVHVESPVEGRLAAVLVKEGQAVKRGDLLLQVEPSTDKEKPEAEDRDSVVSITAPCDGLLAGDLPGLLGSRVHKGEGLASLADNRAMWVHFDMPETRYLAFVTERGKDWRSTDLELILADHSKYPHTGKILQVLASFHNDTGDITFLAEFPNPDGVLRRRSDRHIVDESGVEGRHSHPSAGNVRSS